MPIIVGLLSILAAAYFWSHRARNAKHIADDLVDMASDVRAAARRFGFTRRSNQHPVESIDDPNIAIAAIATAFIALDDLPTREQRDALNVQLRLQLRVDVAGAEELSVLGQWFVAECDGPDPAINRLARKLYKLDGAAAMEPLLTIIKHIVAAGTGTLSTRQKTAVEDLRRAFHVK